ncbi:hypothetical protein ABH926_007738 [Catenulispora sp. GP43]|uniref:hypothetical protein n=1 Tax=Catenulispora sp. GP43 TaxID=3156263 RepID=UPI003517B2FC
MYRSLIRATNAPTSSPGPADDVVAHAEDVVRDSWLRVLRGESDYTGAEMQAASARCDLARRNLAVALLGCDPEAIGVAYADLDGRLAGARIAARAHGQARAALDRALSAADRRAGEQFFDVHVGRRWMLRKRDESTFARGAKRRVRALVAGGWLSQHVLSKRSR